MGSASREAKRRLRRSGHPGAGSLNRSPAKRQPPVPHRAKAGAARQPALSRAISPTRAHPRPPRHRCHSRSNQWCTPGLENAASSAREFIPPTKRVIPCTTSPSGEGRVPPSRPEPIQRGRSHSTLGVGGRARPDTSRRYARGSSIWSFQMPRRAFRRASGNLAGKASAHAQGVFADRTLPDARAAKNTRSCSRTAARTTSCRAPSTSTGRSA